MRTQTKYSVSDNTLLTAALEGLTLQRERLAHQIQNIAGKLSAGGYLHGDDASPGKEKKVRRELSKRKALRAAAGGCVVVAVKSRRKPPQSQSNPEYQL